MPISFPEWVPTAALARLKELETDESITGESRTLIERLSTLLSMRDFWMELPDDPKGRQAFIIDWIIACYATDANGLKPPIPRSTAKIAEYIQHHPLVETSAAMVSGSFRQALRGMSKLESSARDYWSSLWEFEPRLSYDQFVNIVTAGAEFYDRLEARRNADAQDVMTQFHIPLPPRKRRSAKASQIWFSRIMSSLFNTLYGSPMDTLVAIITDVAFDLRGEKGSETARGRRRSGAAHSEK